MVLGGLSDLICHRDHRLPHDVPYIHGLWGSRSKGRRGAHELELDLLGIDSPLLWNLLWVSLRPCSLTVVDQP